MANNDAVAGDGLLQATVLPWAQPMNDEDESKIVSKIVSTMDESSHLQSRSHHLQSRRPHPQVPTLPPLERLHLPTSPTCAG